MSPINFRCAWVCDPEALCRFTNQQDGMVFIEGERVIGHYRVSLLQSLSDFEFIPGRLIQSRRSRPTAILGRLCGKLPPLSEGRENDF